MLVGTPAEGYAACCEAIGGADLWDRLGGIAAPTLVLTGEHDPVAPPERGEAVAAAIRGARHHVVRDAAHIVNAEQPDAFTTAVLDHLSPAEATP
jgi:pimeloyl-ACP methyl ester carboxylesterase